MTANEEIYYALVNHDILIERFKAGEVEKILGMMNDEVLPRISAEIMPIARLGTGENAIEAQARLLDETAGEAIRNTMGELQDDMDVLARTESGFTSQAINNAIPNEVALSFKQASPELLRELAFNTPFQGELLSGWAEDLDMSIRDNILRELRTGMVLGESVPDLSERILGTAQMAFGDGKWEEQLRKAEAVTRTAVNHVNTSARKAVYKENEQYIKGVQFLATLDSRTTVICAEKDNKIYPVDDCPYPPLHFNCRSTTVPAVKSLNELGFDADDYPVSTRESMNGQIAEDIDYEKWLKDKPKVQEKVLGKTNAKMFREGKIGLSDLVKNRTNKLTLAQVMQAENINPTDFASGGLLTRLKNEIGASSV